LLQERQTERVRKALAKIMERHQREKKILAR